MMSSISKNNLVLSSLALTGGAYGLYKGFQVGKKIAHREISENSFFGAGSTGTRNTIKYSFTLLSGVAGALTGFSAAKAALFAINYFTKK